MRIIDSYSQILDLINTEFDLSRWKDYAEKLYPTLPDLMVNDIAVYDFNNDVLPVIHDCYNSTKRIEQIHKHFLSAIANLMDNTLLKDLNCTIIFMVGLCNGAGWVTKYNNTTLVLIGVEKIIELNWDSESDVKGLLYHELGHVWHDQYRAQYTPLNTLSEKSLWQLYSEGFAMLIEQYIYKDYGFYHQDKNGWLKWCQQNRNQIAREFFACIENNQSVREFFGDWLEYRDHSDVGYFLGCELLKEAFDNKSMIELANLTLAEIYEGLKYFIENIK